METILCEILLWYLIAMIGISCIGALWAIIDHRREGVRKRK